MTNEQLLEGCEHDGSMIPVNEVKRLMDEARKQAIADHEAKKTVIKAKALRKKGTDEWYHVTARDGKVAWFTDPYPNIKFGNYDFKHSFGFKELHTDAELIDIEIVPAPKQEGGTK